MSGHVGIWGRSGAGKTTRAKTLLLSRARVVIFDPLGEYADDARIWVRDPVGLVQALRAAWPGGFSIRYLPPAAADPAAELDDVASILRRAQEPFMAGTETRRITLLVEELAMTFPNVRRPRSAFAGLCQRGRHYGVRLIGTSQRMAEVSPTFRGNTSEDYFFPLRASVDYDAAARLLGREHVAALKSLKNHEFLYFDDGRIEKGKNRRFSTPAL